MSASQEVVSKPEETNEYPTKGGRPEQHRLKHALEGRCFRFNSWVFPGIWTLRGWYLGPHKIHLKISTSTWRFIRICGVFCHICMHVSISTRISVWYMYDVLFEFVWYVTSKATSFAHFAIHITFFSPLQTKKDPFSIVFPHHPLSFFNGEMLYDELHFCGALAAPRWSWSSRGLGLSPHRIPLTRPRVVCHSGRSVVLLSRFARKLNGLVNQKVPTDVVTDVPGCGIPAEIGCNMGRI